MAFFKNAIILFVVPPKFCTSIVFNFSWAIAKSQEELKTMLVQNFGGTKKNIMEVLKKAYLQQVTTFANFASAYACIVTRLILGRKISFA